MGLRFQRISPWKSQPLFVLVCLVSPWGLKSMTGASTISWSKLDFFVYVRFICLRFHCYIPDVSLVRLRAIWMTNHPHSVLWHCWSSHQTRKNIVPDMTYTVSSGTLNRTQSNPISPNYSSVLPPWVQSRTSY